MLAAIHAFAHLQTGELDALNEATLILVPKKPDAHEPKDFRPISLICFFAKLISKMLAKRLQPKMETLVNPAQSAFIKGRVIHDNFNYVQGLARSYFVRKLPALLLKLDIEKAFDSVSWDFLLEVLEARGFGQKWRNWISAILATASTRILINGELSDRIWHRRGLRQGDPLSPLLFVLVMDVLPALLTAADTVGALKPIGSQLPRFRASLYADDVIMFINPCHDEVTATRRILDAFGEASGLRTNFAKSTISPIRCQDTPLQPLVLESNCQIAELPCTYLGLPLSVTRLTRAQLQPAIDKILNKMASWNTISSAAGRLTLLLSVVYAMPIFQILAVHPPAWFIKRIDKAARGFLWANKESAPGAKCLVGWKQVCKPKMYGGLGIPDLAARSIALRCRWLWQTWMCPDKPWVGLSLPIDNKVRAIFDASVIIHIGDGEKTQFWTDGWRQEGKLCTLFPDLYLHCTLRRISIKRALENDKWIRHFKAPLPSAAVRQFTELWAMLRPVRLTPGTPDTLTWRWTADGAYSASSAYAMQYIGTIRPAFPSIIWRADVPPKCKFFTWLAVQGKCLTADVLARRGCPHDPLCPLCRSSPETASHLLMTCPFAQDIWTRVLGAATLPLSFRPPSDAHPSDWLCSSGQRLDKTKSKLWRATVPLVWWNVWIERNDRIFRQRQTTAEAVFHKIIAEGAEWVQAGRRSVQGLLHRPLEPD
jgi:hypothetical protein